MKHGGCKGGSAAVGETETQGQPVGSEIDVRHNSEVPPLLPINYLGPNQESPTPPSNPHHVQGRRRATKVLHLKVTIEKGI